MLDGVNRPQIKVFGIGNGASNAVNRMIEEGLQGVEFIAVNTDAQALMLSRATHRVQVGEKLTKGFGCDGDPDIGVNACEDLSDDLYKVISGSDLVFVTAGMGGGTGTGGAPVVARIARETGALTIGVVTIPFSFEGSRRRQVAEEGIARVKEHANTLIVISNDRLLEIVDRPASIRQAFRVADDVFRQGIQGISELLTMPALINLDITDVRVIMAEGGAALMAIGHGEGDNKGIEASETALASSLLDVTMDGARGILFNVTGGPDLSLFDVSEAAEIIRKTADPEANIVFGAVTDETMEDRARITIIATGLGPPRGQGPPRRRRKPPNGWPSPSLSSGSPPSPIATHGHASRDLEER